MCIDGIEAMKYKKELVVFAGDYYPYPSPNGVCLRNLLEGWKDKINITVIAYNQDNGEKYRTIDGIDYIFINSFAMNLQNRCRYKKDKFHKLLALLLRLWRGVKTSIFWLRFDRKYYYGCVEETKKLLRKKKIDAVFAACYPFSAIYAAYQCKRRFGIDYVTYIMDVYSQAVNLRKFCLFGKRYAKKDRKEELEVLRNAKMNYLSEGFVNADAYKQVLSGGVAYEIVGFPIIGDAEVIGDAEEKDNYSVNKNDGVTLFYAGTFVRGIREPDAIMDIFSREALKELKVTLCTTGNCQDDLQQWAKTHDNVDYRGTVSRDIAADLLENSDILINVANLNSHQIPSKIFEYFAKGKPIVNFYAEEKNNEIFDGYPYVLHIPQKGITDADAERLYGFCMENKGKRVSAKEVRQNYKQYTIDYLRKLILDKIEE